MCSRRLNEGVLRWDRRGGIFSLKDQREWTTGRGEHVDEGVESSLCHICQFNLIHQTRT